MTSAQAGKYCSIDIQSRDNDGQILDNDDDNYLVKITDDSGTELLSVTATYQTAG